MDWHMDLREWMVLYRKMHLLSRFEMARRCGISEKLLRIVEEGGVTHPNIAKRIGKMYELTDLETEELMSVNQREHGGDYEPDRYVHEIFSSWAREDAEIDRIGKEIGEEEKEEEYE